MGENLHIRGSMWLNPGHGSTVRVAVVAELGGVPGLVPKPRALAKRLIGGETGSCRGQTYAQGAPGPDF